ncbi:MAG: Activator of Hsp90 ATPase 1 family protein, partial [Aeromicrobium sp.]|nr:Activator of Hsp90 ATPase 1 family protein [Aeromicrobium sp.]
TITAEPSTQQITITRDLDAPVALVYRAFTEPDLLAQWMGPDRLTCEVTELDVRHGGRWAIVHRDTDGTEFGFRGVFHGEPTPELMMRTFEWLGLPGHVSFETLRLEARGDGRTRVHTSAVFQTVEDRDGMINNGMDVGVNEGYTRLDEILAGLS